MQQNGAPQDHEIHIENGPDTDGCSVGCTSDDSYNTKTVDIQCENAL